MRAEGCTNERELLEMALVGYALVREYIEMEIEMVRLMLAIDIPMVWTGNPARPMRFAAGLEESGSRLSTSTARARSNKKE